VDVRLQPRGQIWRARDTAHPRRVGSLPRAARPFAVRHLTGPGPGMAATAGRGVAAPRPSSQECRSRAGRRVDGDSSLGRTTSRSAGDCHVRLGLGGGNTEPAAG
jgi:hypothetical protein